MKYPKWVMELVDIQEREDDIDCTDPRALFVMQWILLTTLLSMLSFGLGVLATYIIW